ncbi:MAG: hypothetical protein VX466_12530 [Myxococcota bacterium]|nr:hypothetical protein [Myxococcota bacterium]
MLGTRLFVLALVSFALVVTSVSEVSAQKMYKGSWIAESFGNDKVGVSLQPGGATTPSGGYTYKCSAGASACFQAYGMPQGRMCNPLAPRCNLSATPVDATGNFNPQGPNCHVLTAGELPRPAKGGTASFGVFPLYRNPNFFTASGAPKTTYCNGYSSYYSTTTSNPIGYYATTYLGPGNPQRGYVMKGAPVSGSGIASTTMGADPVAFSFPAAVATDLHPNVPDLNGMRRSTYGEFSNIPPYLYSYTYANLRNDAGAFAAGGGFFSGAATATKATFVNKFTAMSSTTTGTTSGTIAKVTVKRGANSFGGTMKLLGTLTTKVCYFYAGGCSLGEGDWGYEHIGAAGAKAAGVVTAAYTTSIVIPYYNTALATKHSTTAVASRWPWTTGTVTVSATVRGPHKTFEVRKGFDTRSAGIGSVQLVSPILTTWLGVVNFETAGIAVLKMEFVPEPGVLVGLVAGLSLLGVLYRVRS